MSKIDSSLLRRLVSEDKLYECINKFKLQLLKLEYSNSFDNVILLERSLRAIDREGQLNIRDNREILIERNRIVFSLLKEISYIDEQDISSDKKIGNSPAVIHLKKKFNTNLIVLEEYLKKSDFKGADIHTTRIFLSFQESDYGESAIRKETILNFPLQNLIRIDALWLKYSNGRFGFSIQSDIWKTLNSASTSSNIKGLEKYGGYNGWMKNGEWISEYGNLDFTILAEPGHLPTLRQLSLDDSTSWWSSWVSNVRAVLELANKLP